MCRQPGFPEPRERKKKKKLCWSSFFVCSSFSVKCALLFFARGVGENGCGGDQRPQGIPVCLGLLHIGLEIDHCYKVRPKLVEMFTQSGGGRGERPRRLEPEGGKLRLQLLGEVPGLQRRRCGHQTAAEHTARDNRSRHPSGDAVLGDGCESFAGASREGRGRAGEGGLWGGLPGLGG